jgi:hypothetical protein
VGKRQAVVRVEVSAKGKEASPVCLVALLSQGNFATQAGPSIPTPPFLLPNRLAECQRWTDALFYRHNPPSTFIRTWTPTGGHNALWSPGLGQNARDQWVKLDKGETGFDIFSLAVICDLVSPLSFLDVPHHASKWMN